MVRACVLGMDERETALQIQQLRLRVAYLRALGPHPAQHRGRNNRWKRKAMKMALRRIERAETPALHFFCSGVNLHVEEKR